jgi:hypothetical protein
MANVISGGIFMNSMETVTRWPDATAPSLYQTVAKYSLNHVAAVCVQALQ